MFVTTSLKGSIQYEREAIKIAKLLDIPYRKRQNYRVRDLCENYCANNFLTITSEGPVLYNKEGHTHGFHLSMAQLRILRLIRNEVDYLVEAVKSLGPIEKGESIKLVDATLGLASDSITLAFAFKEGISILGLEENKILAYITNYGLRHWQDNPNMKYANQIQVIAMNHSTFFSTCRSNSYDIVYMDHMFERPIEESPQFKVLRPLLRGPGEVNLESFEEALRVSRFGLIIKERPGASIFKKLGISEFIGGKYSRVIYGILRKNG